MTVTEKVGDPQVNITAPFCPFQTGVSEQRPRGGGVRTETASRSRAINVSRHLPIVIKNGHIGHFFLGIYSREEMILNMREIHKEVHHKDIFNNKEVQAF